MKCFNFKCVSTKIHFDAMNSSRVYRKNLSSEYIINELKNNKRTQFDPKIAEVMLKLISEGKVKIVG